MAQTYEQVLSDLQAGKFAPVYFLQGEEPFFIDLISDYIEKHALSETEKGFNQTIAYGKEVQMSEILTHARRFPMMAERQVVIVKEAQEVADLNREGGQKLLLDYLEQPQPTTVLVFCHKYKSLDKRKALGKTIDKKAVVVSTKKLYDNQVPSFIENFVRGKGLKISPKATYLLAQNIGNNLERINNELEKVVINLNGSGEIDENHIQEFVGISKDYNIFEFQNALINRDVFKSNQIADYFASNTKNNPLVLIIASVYGLFSKLLVVHYLKKKGESDKSLASQLRVNPYFVKDYVRGAANYSESKVVENLAFISKADLNSKGIDAASQSEKQVLTDLIYRLLH